MFSELVQCVSARWSPTIGDATIGGWATVGAYGLGALACIARAYLLTRQPSDVRQISGFSPQAIWLCFAAFLLALGVNKQMDLQSALTAFGRCLAFDGGWYEARRLVQGLFILGLLASAAIIGWAAMRRMSTFPAELKLAVFGAFLLGLFIILRAASFHHVDFFLKSDVGVIRWNWLLEIGGIVVISLAALSPRKAERLIRRWRMVRITAAGRRAMLLARYRKAGLSAWSLKDL